MVWYRSKTPPIVRVRPEDVETLGLIVDLGIITVPTNYEHSTCLARFAKSNGWQFKVYHSDIKDENFQEPSYVLEPGDRLWVRAFKTAKTHEECMDFLTSQNAVFPSAQGAALLWEQKGDQLPKGWGYFSCDKEERLFSAGAWHKALRIDVYSDDNIHFHLRDVGRGRHESDAILCICRVPAKKV